MTKTDERMAGDCVSRIMPKERIEQLEAHIQEGGSFQNPQATIFELICHIRATDGLNQRVDRQPGDCRKAFEEWAFDHWQNSHPPESAWTGWQAAWNRRKPEREAASQGTIYDSDLR